MFLPSEGRRLGKYGADHIILAQGVSISPGEIFQNSELQNPSQMHSIEFVL